MSDYSHLTLAKLQMNERIEETRRSRIPGRRSRHTNRHTIASGLHSLANRIDG